MTGVRPVLPAAARNRLTWARRHFDRTRAVAWGLPIAAAVANALVFVAMRVPVGDLWAARARESAAASGVGLNYWFAWFDGGTAPGAYSIVTPYLSVLAGAALLGAGATILTTPLCAVATRKAAHPVAATWVATVAAGLNLWSGRIAFSVGTALAVLALCAVQVRSVWLAAVAAASAAVLAVLASPVAGALLVVALSGVLFLPRGRRLPAVAALAAVALALGVLALVYPAPGIEPFGATTARGLALALCAMVIARPLGFVTVPVLLSLAVCWALTVYPNALGSNFNRMVWIWLPIEVVATARRPAIVAVSCVALGVYLGARTTTSDLEVAYAPASATAQYPALLAAMDRVRDLASYRVEAVSDGTHDAAYFLLNHAQLARGYETQADERLNAVIVNGPLNADAYRGWLDANAVGYVVLHRIVVHPSAEYRLVSGGLPYLHAVWSSPNWVLYRVVDPTPIASSPARIVDADQSNIVITVPTASSVLLRLHWSSALHLSGPLAKHGHLETDGTGWTRLIVDSAGQFQIAG